MPKTQEWIARENIARFRQMIAEASSAKDRENLEKLLADEELRLEEAERRLREDKKR
jgi:hypothetical protein